MLLESFFFFIRNLLKITFLLNDFCAIKIASFGTEMFSSVLSTLARHSSTGLELEKRFNSCIVEKITATGKKPKLASQFIFYQA